MTIRYAYKTVDNIVIICLSHATYKQDMIKRLKLIDGVYDMDLDVTKLWLLSKYEFLSLLPLDKTIVFRRNPTTQMSVIIGRIETSSSDFERMVWCG